MMNSPYARITIDPASCHGQPCVRGLRYPVEFLLDLLSSGMSFDEILGDYPDLERDDLLAVLAFAARLARSAPSRVGHPIGTSHIGTNSRGHGMNTSGDVKSGRTRAHVPSTALAKSVEFDDAMMRVSFTDGRVLCVPIAWFPTLLAATPEQRALCEIGGGGIGVHWPGLDEDLSIAGLMAGVDWRSA